METRHTAVRWRRVAAAAARLAALYAAGVAILVLAYALSTEALPTTLSDLLPLAGAIAVLFLVGFVLLALARRAGFAALWLLLLGLWAWMLVAGWRLSPLTIPMQFVAWTILALPLYALGALGVPATHRLRVGRRGASLVPLALVVWLGLAAAGIYFTALPHFPGPHPSRRAVAEAAAFIWALAPFLIAALALAHVWLGTRRSSAS